LALAWADRELLLMPRLEGDLGEALLHGGTDCFGVFDHGTVLVVSCSPPGSF
jgi:hypothetical protein